MSVFLLCRRFRRLLNTSTFSTLVENPDPKPQLPTAKSIFKTRNSSQLVEEFKLLSRSKKFRAKHGVYLHTVRRLASANNQSAIDDILQAQKSYEEIRDEGFLIRLISLYGRGGMLDHAQKLFDEMPQLSCPRSVKSFNSLLKAAVQAGNMEECERIFHEVPGRSSIVPDAISYNILVHALCENGHVERAVSIVEEMEAEGVQPNPVTFNTLLDAFYEGGRFTDAEKIWEVMVKKGLAASTRTYNGKIRGLMRHERAEEAVAVVENIGVEADAFSYGHLIEGFCGKGKVEEAKKWYGKLLLRKELVPHKSTMESMMLLAREAGDADLAMRLCQQIIKQRCWVGKEVLQGSLGLVLDKFGDGEARKIVVKLKAMGFQVDFQISP